MKKYLKYIVAFFFFISQPVLAQQGTQNTNSKKEYVIPFQLTAYNNLSVQAILNDTDTVHLMFHTAANDLTLIEKSVARLKTLKFSGAADSVKSWGGQANTSRFSKSNALQIGPMKWENIPVWENTNTGQNTDGKFGLELFKNKAIEIDFDKNVIVIHSALPSRMKGYQKLKLSFENDMMFIEAGCTIDGHILTNKFLLHSGYAGGILLDDEFVTKNALDDKLTITGEKELKDSYGNILKTKKAVLPFLQIGNEKLPDVPVGFFSGAIGRQKMSIIGGDILKRFNIIIDAKREFIYVKANHFRSSGYLNI